MIQFLSEKTAKYLARDEDPEDIEVIAYGYYMFYQQWLVIIGMLLVALATGLFWLVLASLVTSMVLRGTACGTHATHPLICKMAAFALAFTPAILAGVVGIRLVPTATIVMYLLSIALLVKYAPGDTDVKKIHDPSIRRSMKIQSIIWASVFFAAAALLQDRLPDVAFVVALTALVTCSFVHPVMYWLFGFDPVTKEARGCRR